MSESGSNSLIDMEDEGESIDAEVVLQQLLDNSELIQHLSRTTHEGRQTIAGYFRIEFQPGEQRHILHIPLTPALKIIPQVTAHVTDHQDVRVRITERQKFGIRAEVILARVAESIRRVLVEIIATEIETDA